MVTDVGGFVFSASTLRKVHKRFSRTAPIADLYYPLYLRKSVLLNAPSSISMGFQMFKRFLSQETISTISVFQNVAKARKTLVADLDMAVMPQCYGGELTALSVEKLHEFGLDAIEMPLLAQQFQGPRTNLGGFHMPPPTL